MPKLIKYQVTGYRWESPIFFFYLENQSIAGPFDSKGKSFVNRLINGGLIDNVFTRFDTNEKIIKDVDMELNSSNPSDGIKVLYRVELTEEESGKFKKTCEEIATEQSEIEGAMSRIEDLVKEKIRI